MESRTLLDYALFQLTPTRTRCDLVIFAGKKSEKLASGLLEPFLSHLKSAKDQISKGGYSITLQPTNPDASWFTKATLERFVRFVNTPEVLERFVTIEREIGQIECSIVSNEQANETAEVQGNVSASDANFKVQGAPSKLKVESTDSRVDEPQEKPKVRLQRVLESRKEILKKEQAMAYARALVAGFEMNSIHDLVSFSDAFGALRLREACINFAELCNKKNDDKIWMDEVAAMQACSHSELSYLGSSGIILASEDNSLMKASAFDSIPSHERLDIDKGRENGFSEGSDVKATEGMAQGPTWANHLPHYMQNFQSPIFQQIQPYPGYVFPGMQVASSHYPDNMLWPSNFQDSRVHLDRDRKNCHQVKSSTKKEKISNNLQSQDMKHGEGIETENSSSSDSSDYQEHEPNLSSHDKMHNKKRSKRSSRKVVIRNINYIASGRNGERSSASGSDSSDEDEFIDADSLKQHVEEAVGSLKRHQKPSTHRNKVQDRSRKTSNKSRDAVDDENAGTTISKEEKKDGNWDIFQNLLMRDADSRLTDMDTKSTQFQEECFKEKFNGEENLSSSTMNKVPKGYVNDSFLLNGSSTLNGIEVGNVKFEDRENFQRVVKIRSKGEELLIPSRAEAETYSLNAHFGTESSIIKSQKEEDWIISSQPGQGDRVDHASLFDDKASACFDDHLQVDRNKRDMDDSFMVQSQLSDNPLNTPPKADIFMVSDMFGANQSNHSMLENLQSKLEAGNYYEPNDLCMVLRRDSTADQVVASWKPDMEYENSNSLAQHTTKPIDSVEDTLVSKDNESNIKTRIAPGRKVDGKTTKSKPPVSSLGRSKSETTSRSKISTLGSRMIKNKSEKEEEKTKKLEELRIQHQKRIAERSATKGFTSEASRSLKESKRNTASTEVKKLKPQAPYDKNKPPQKVFMRNSTINRLATPRATNKQFLTESKKTTPRESFVMATPSMKKKKGTPQGKDKVNPSDKKSVTNNSNDNSLKTPKRDFTDATPSILGESTSVEATTDDKKQVQVLSAKDLLSLDNPSSQMNPLGDTDDHVVLAPQITVHPTIGNYLRLIASNIDENDDEKNKFAISPEISTAGVSTPPSNAETIPEVIHSRKKWNDGENFLKAPKGFRKLLLFGRKI